MCQFFSFFGTSKTIWKITYLSVHKLGSTEYKYFLGFCLSRQINARSSMFHVINDACSFLFWEISFNIKKTSSELQKFEAIHHELKPARCPLWRNAQKCFNRDTLCASPAPLPLTVRTEMLEVKILQSSNMAGDCKDFPQCTLDKNGCLKLSSILHAFNAAVSEEQAWAVCFQTAKCMVNEWNSDSSSCYCLSDTSHVLMHKDGYIHRSTVKLCSKGKIHSSPPFLIIKIYHSYKRASSNVYKMRTTCSRRARTDGFCQPGSRPVLFGCPRTTDRQTAVMVLIPYVPW